ncbi:MAG: TetR/AcrR family transcriptional regulator [Treponema sp.]|nr:TetR/AcrR family transcriptional regulator [Candidatus Treponema caballi]
MCAQLTQRGKRRIDTDEKILQAAMHQFGEKGFTSASLTDIAAEAGISQGLVSQRFESKEKLLEAAFKATPAASFFLSATAGKAVDAANDSASADLSATLLSIVTALKKEQHTDRRRFAFTAMLYTARDVPESFTALSHKLYQGTVLPALSKKAPGDGSLVSSPSKGDTYHLFLVFYRNALAVIRDCGEAGIPLPEDSYFLAVLGLIQGDGSPVTLRKPGDGSLLPGDGSPVSAIAAFKEQVRPALRAIEGYIGLIRKHAGEPGRVRDYASKAELIASELVRNLDKLK